MATQTAVYEMNPATDTLKFSDELAEGMQVIPESQDARYQGPSEDARLRAQRFCTVTRLRRIPRGDGGTTTVFIGEWVDGFQKSFSAVAPAFTWIVRQDSIPGAESA